MPTPFPHQIEGARFLASRQAALLADDPRVGKTGAAIMACDYVLARKILVVTTASGRPNWAREFREWQVFPRRVQVLYTTTEKVDPLADVVVLGWAGASAEQLHAQLIARSWDVLILDESHYAKATDAQRAQAIYGAQRGLHLKAARVWCLTGTPIPNAPNDLWPMLYALDRKRLGEHRSYDDFVKRYCFTRTKRQGGRDITVVLNGINLPELSKRLDGFWLRRTQEDVGIRPPIYSVFSVAAPRTDWPLQSGVNEAGWHQEVIAAAESGDTATLEMHLGTLRRITGTIKAHGVAEAVKEEFEAGLDKIVLMAWHKDTMAVLRKELHDFGVVGIEGSTSPTARDTAVELFTKSPHFRVFIGQIQAAGEAIDLSAAANLMFVEPSFVPAHMSQAALRVTNINQRRQVHVRVAALAGSIDEAVMAVLVRKTATIREVMKNAR